MKHKKCRDHGTVADTVVAAYKQQFHPFLGDIHLQKQVTHLSNTFLHLNLQQDVILLAMLHFKRWAIENFH